MRLIDADNFKGKVIASHCYSGVNKLINIDDVPTAYDVDKVVEELDAYITKLVGKKSALYQTIIGIVKAGGSDGNTNT